MPVYNQFPRLYQQGQNPTTQYYGGLARPNPIGNSLGNQSIAKSGPAGTAQTAPLPAQNQYQIGVDPSTGMLTLNGQVLSRNDPRLYGSRGYQTGRHEVADPTAGDSGAGTTWADPSEYWDDFNTRYGSQGMRQLGSAGVSSGQEGQGFGELNINAILNGQVQYDPEYGFVTASNNVDSADDPDDRARMRRVRTAMALAAGGMVGAEMGLFGNLAGASSGAIPEMAATSLSASGAPWSAGMLPAEGLMYGTGAAATGAATAGGGTGMTIGPITGSVPADVLSGGAAATGTAATSGAFPWGQVAGNLAGFLGNRYLQGQNEGRYNSLMDRADPWGEANRAESQRRLWELFKDPSSIANTPGYQFSQQQGEQGISRAAAQKGYFRSPNMLYDLSKFNQGLAQQTWDREVNRLMAMSGVQFDPSNAARIGAQGAQNSNNMNAAGITQLIGAGGNILDWLFGGNGGFV